MTALPVTDRRARLAAAHLYAITPDLDPDRLAELALAVLRGGADVLQLRHKTLSRGRLLELAQRLRAATAEAGALLVVNDHVDIAMLAEADGVHLGDDDLSVAEARRLGGAHLLVGATASTPDAARAAVTAGADYLGAGPAFVTPIKAAKPAIGPAGVAAVQAAVPVPVFAIGGIEPATMPAVLAAGIRRVCMIRGLAEAADPQSVARQVRAALVGGG